MRIEIKQLGTVLSSRPAGKEALLAIRSSLLRDVKKTEVVELNFAGVDALTPSWADEFVTPLKEEWGGMLHYINTENPSVTATLEFLKTINADRR
ncbi:MAG: DUF4325 domain-containing protein [Patescibacteria group bacterium]